MPSDDTPMTIQLADGSFMEVGMTYGEAKAAEAEAIAQGEHDKRVVARYLEELTNGTAPEGETVQEMYVRLKEVT